MRELGWSESQGPVGPMPIVVSCEDVSRGMLAGSTGVFQKRLFVEPPTGQQMLRSRFKI